MADVVKSIFRQREVEKLYKIGITNHVSTEFYSYYYCTTIVIDDENGKVITDKEIGRYDIEIPMLEIGDKFFLHDINEVVVIKSRMRSSDGSIIYYVEDKMIETDNSKKSYEECTQRVENLNDKKERLKKLEKEFEDYKKEYKYKNRFFNIKESKNILF